MKKVSIFTSLVLSIFISGCSFVEPNIPINDNENLKLEKNRDYLATVSRKNELHIVDTTTNKLYKTCKLQGSYMSGGMIISPKGDTAYILQDNWGAVYGYDLNSCENTFIAKFSQESNVREMSIFSFTLSPDGKKLYTISNPTQMLNDRYKVLDPVFKTFNTNDGLDAKPIDSFKAPRQITVMSTADDGTIYAAGSNIYKIDTEKKEFVVAKKLRNWDKTNYSSPDTLAMWPIGSVSKEFLLMYTTAKFPNDKMDINEAEFFWGATRVDLKTNEIVQEEFAPLEYVMFTGMTHPKDSNLLYGVLTDLTKFDRKNQKVLKRVWLDRTYYCINFATDGSKIYLGGTFNDIAVYNPDTLEKITKITLPDGDVGAGTLQVFQVK